jgi:anti-sigma factor RsiW
MSEPLNCEEALRLLATYLDEELEPGSTREVTQHLDTCRSCYSRAEFERRLKGQLAELRQGPVDNGFEQRIRALIRSAAAASD